jgi:hypothetical protein
MHALNDDCTGPCRFVVIDLSAGPCTYGKIETEEGSVSYRSLPRLSQIIFPRGLAAPSAPSTQDIFIGQLGGLMSTTIEHVIAPDVRYCEKLEFHVSCDLLLKWSLLSCFFSRAHMRVVYRCIKQKKRGTNTPVKKGQHTHASTNTSTNTHTHTRNTHGSGQEAKQPRAMRHTTITHLPNDLARHLNLPKQPPPSILRAPPIDRQTARSDLLTLPAADGEGPDHRHHLATAAILSNTKRGPATVVHCRGRKEKGRVEPRHRPPC